jgi:adenylate cyclase
MATLSDSDSLATTAYHASRAQAMLFADVAGSTRLYDTLGDTIAKSLVDECIHMMRTIVARYGGRVVKTIGDEVMCVLPDADNACLAAMDMQLRISAMPASSGVQRAIRAGSHAGPVIEENNDVFGDSVNLAARMAGLAEAMQIITTQATVEQLSPLLRNSTRSIAALSVKGKLDDIAVCEVIWQAGDELTMVKPSIAQQAIASRLQLRHGTTELVLDLANASVVLGRDTSCQIEILDRMASRQHARIERRSDKFFLVDQSTNGTFVSVAGDADAQTVRFTLLA